MNKTLNHRDPTPHESDILAALTEVDFKGRSDITVQLKNLKVALTEDEDNYGSLHLIPATGVPIADTEGRVPVEGLVNDTDEVPICILLHVQKGLVNELEIFKVDGNPILQKIDPELIQIKVNQV